jgi:hypothetical protein
VGQADSLPTLAHADSPSNRKSEIPGGLRRSESCSQTLDKRPAAGLTSRILVLSLASNLIFRFHSGLCRFWWPFVALSVIALLLSCGRPSKGVAAATVPVDRFSEAAPRGRDANDVGRFLAGLPGMPGGPFSDLESQDTWRAHRRELDKAWGDIEATRLPSMRDFQMNELSGPAIEKSLVFYPFSGPDALAPTIFFPRSPTYVLVGLEPPGTLPTRGQLERKDLARTLAAVRNTVHSELHRSFFITRQMDSQFRGQVTDGLFLPILHLLVRTNHTVLGHRHVRLDDEGRIVERGAATVGAGGNKGIEIDFSANTDQSIHKLFYFSINLSDERMGQNKPFLAFLARLKGMTSYFKATSYMTHKAQFSLIRDQVLAKSDAILQDDSGIPYRFFQAQPWRVQLYGNYARPYGSFRWLEQPDLKKAYSASNPKSLDFEIGYGFKRIPSNLLFATKGR